jgi:hypothetical protein
METLGGISIGHWPSTHLSQLALANWIKEKYEDRAPKPCV